MDAHGLPELLGRLGSYTDEELHLAFQDIAGSEGIHESGWQVKDCFSKAASTSVAVADLIPGQIAEERWLLIPMY